MYLNPDVFFLLKPGKIYIWDYLSHTQYELEKEYLLRLIEISNGSSKKSDDIIDQELSEAGIISKTPYRDINWQWDELSRIYHFGTQNVHGDFKPQTSDEWIEEYLKVCEEVEKNHREDGYDLSGRDVIQLPLPDLDLVENTSLWNSIKNRMTSRQFDGSEVKLSEISTLLYIGFGNIHGNDWKELKDKRLKQLGSRKAQPSGGGLHPISCYLLSLHIDGLENGIYEYISDDHTLIKKENIIKESELTDLFCGQFYAEGIAAGLFMVGKFDKVWHKYKHSRSYRDLYLDAGHASQSVLLGATALKLQTWVTAWYDDQRISDILELSEDIESNLFFIGVGHGEPSPLPIEVEKYLNR